MSAPRSRSDHPANDTAPPESGRGEAGAHVPPAASSADALHDDGEPPRSRITRDVAARGARVRFVESGEGRPVLLIHGFLGSHSSWDDTADLLAQDFRTITPDLPGFGESEKPPAARYKYDADAFAESLVDLVAALDLGRVAVVGHDLGGSIALTMAARHPAVVERLVLVAPIVYPYKPDLYSRLATTPIVGPIAFKQLSGPGIFGRYFRRRSYAAPEHAPPGRVESLFEAFNAPAAREAAYATLESLADTRTLVALLPRVQAPTLVVWGRNDRLLPLDHGRRLVRELPNPSLEILDAGHSPHEETAAEVAEKAKHFLRGAPKSRGRTPTPRRKSP